MRSLNILILSSLVLVIGCAQEEEPNKPAVTDQPTTQPAKSDTGAANYPVEICIVSGEKLGSMGDRIDVESKSLVVTVCCSGCVAELKDDPDTFLAKLDAAAKGEDAAREARSGHAH